MQKIFPISQKKRVSNILLPPLLSITIPMKIFALFPLSCKVLFLWLDQLFLWASGASPWQSFKGGLVLWGCMCFGQRLCHHFSEHANWKNSLTSFEPFYAVLLQILQKCLKVKTGPICIDWCPNVDSRNEMDGWSQWLMVVGRSGYIITILSLFYRVSQTRFISVYYSQGFFDQITFFSGHPVWQKYRLLLQPLQKTIIWDDLWADASTHHHFQNGSGMAKLIKNFSPKKELKEFNWQEMSRLRLILGSKQPVFFLWKLHRCLGLDHRRDLPPDSANLPNLFWQHLLLS